MIDWFAVEDKLSEHTPEGLTLDEKLDYLYNKMGLSLEKIADLTRGECCNISIRHKMKELGIKLRSPGGVHHYKKADITFEEYTNSTYLQLTRRYNISLSTVYNRVKKFERKRKTYPTLRKPAPS